MGSPPSFPPTADHSVDAGEHRRVVRPVGQDGAGWPPIPRAEQRERDPGTGRSGRRWPGVLVAVVAALGVVATWRVFVLTRTGQLVDQAAFDGSVYGRSRLWRVAEPVLEVVSIPFVGLVLISVMIVAVLRRRALLALQVAVLVGGSNVAAQLLKRVLLTRPDQDIGTVHNTLPSGHTTVAASVSIALVLVVPRRLRPAAALLGVAYTAATGVSTLVGRWHRPSDVVAAVLLVLAWAGLAAAIGWEHRGADVGRRARRTTLGVAGLLAAAAAVAGLGAALALRHTVAQLDGGLLTGRAELLAAYGGGGLGVVAVVCATFAAVLLLLDAVEPRPGTRRAVR